jgi:hypothetical protein
MLKRKVILSRGSVLWYAGDTAPSFAILETGKLGVKNEKGLVGVIWPNMVLGEAALLTLEGEQPRRTSTVFALEEGTTVVEYPPLLVKQALDEQGRTVWKAILTTLLGQICRTCLVLVSAHKEQPFLAQPFKSLMQSLVQTYRSRFATLSSWDDFSSSFHFLHATRDYTDAAQRLLVGPFANRDDIVRASELTREYFQGQGEIPFLTDFLEAAKETYSVREGPDASWERRTP